MSKKYLRSIFCLLCAAAFLFSQSGFEQAVRANATPQTVAPSGQILFQQMEEK